jgi:uncharacterized protein (DUF169 family)
MRAQASALINTLGLERAPVALAFMAEAPAGVVRTTKAVPSACTFWRQAETGLVYAEASDHYECPVGAMTMGFELPAAQQPAAQELVETMVGLGYFEMAEVAHLPSVTKPHQGLLYGPLADFPVAPDMVLVIASPRQAMLLAEAAGAVTLRETPALATMGRPACAAVARGMNAGQETLSLGCIGARTYVEVPDDHLILALPGADLPNLLARLATIDDANTALAGYHREKKVRFES